VIAIDCARKGLAEFLGTAFLLAAVVGSGIMGERLAGGNVAIALLANAFATAGVLAALIAALGPICGAHLNPAVSIFEFFGGRLDRMHLFAYLPAQAAGAVVGVAMAHAMFGLPLLQASAHARSSSGEIVAEVVATLGLLLTIWGTSRADPSKVPMAVAGYIAGAYWFTSSTSFANPAVTLARSLTDTFSGIDAGSVPLFIAAQVLGVAAAFVVTRLIAPR
jgi:glycerol uptake facilitator-like aquaporin